MTAYIKKYILPILLAFTILKILTHVYDGYFIAPLFYFLIVLFFTEIIRYALILGCLVKTTNSILKRQFRLGFTLSWVALAVLGLIPKGHFMTLGAVLSIYNTDPQQFRDDARAVLEQYKPMTCFSNFPQRTPCNEPVSKNKLPGSILNANIGDVLVLDNYVFLEKFGLLGLFRGFVVFREGADVWSNEKSISLLDGCDYCWRIRVLDGLYWYHAVPTKEERSTFTLPLK